jgi:N-acetylneuraminic acid mutarotase
MKPLFKQLRIVPAGIILCAIILSLHACGVIYSSGSKSGSEETALNSLAEQTIPKGGWKISAGVVSTTDLSEGVLFSGAYLMEDQNLLAINYFGYGEIFNRDSESWVSISKPDIDVTDNIFLHSCRIHGTDMIVAIGEAYDANGFGQYLIGTSPVLIYDYSEESWVVVSSNIRARTHFSLACPTNGKVLLIGGMLNSDADTENYGPSTSVEIYDPGSGTWSNAAEMNYGRTNPVVVEMNNGKVLVIAAGDLTYTDPVPQKTAEVYDSATDSWTVTGNLTTGRMNAEAILLDDGKVMVAGGYSIGTGYLNAVEVYDLETNSWSVTASMAYAKTGFSLIRLPNGNVIAVGGRFQDEIHEEMEVSGALSTVITIVGGEIRNEAEIYDTAAGEWTEVSSMQHPRENLFGALLATGEVLVGGGYGGFDAESGTSVEIFTLSD